MKRVYIAYDGRAMSGNTENADVLCCFFDPSEMVELTEPSFVVDGLIGGLHSFWAIYSYKAATNPKDSTVSLEREVHEICSLDPKEARILFAKDILEKEIPKWKRK